MVKYVGAGSSGLWTTSSSLPMRHFIRTSLVFLLAIFLVWIVWALLVFQITIPTAGEEPSLLSGDRLMVSRTSYGLRLPFECLFGLHRTAHHLPQRGDCIAFNDPLSNKTAISSRPVCIGTCTALPGDTVWLTWQADKDVSPNSNKKYPFIIPKAHSPIDVRPWNITLLANMLHLHESRNVCWDCGNQLVVDGKPLKKVCFSQDYLWIFNKRNPQAYDSRLFGFLPYSHVIGSLLCISYSKDPTQPFYKGYRYERFFMPVTRQH